MTKFAAVALLAILGSAPAFAASAEVRDAAALSASAPLAVSAGKMLYGTDGKRIGQIYRVTGTGDVQLIVAARLVTVPATTLSEVNGKVTTSLSKTDLNRR